MEAPRVAVLELEVLSTERRVRRCELPPEPIEVSEPPDDLLGGPGQRAGCGRRDSVP